MTANAYDIGDQARMTGTFTNSAGSAVDPTTITFKVKNPAGTITAYVYDTDPEVVRLSTGIYYVDYSITAYGDYWYTFVGTGDAEAAGETMFWARATRF